VTLALAVAVALGLVLTGCDSQPDPTASTPTKSVRKAPSVAGGDADMTSAFSATRGQPGLVEVKFKLSKRPTVGEPVDIELAMIPTVELERLFARFQGTDGLQIVAGAESEHFEHPAKDTPVSHKVTVTATADGIYSVTAIVLADSDKESIARTFSIPLIAGQGLTETPAAPAAASVADSKRPSAQP
jgi:hypothetical protein